MKITKEWLEQEIAQCDKNIAFLKKKDQEANGVWKDLLIKEEGIKNGYEDVLFRKMLSNRSCILFHIDTPMWKRRIIRFLKHICDWLEGVENAKPLKRDLLEKKNDEARKRYRTINNIYMNTKEIHFYTNLCDIEQVSDWDLDTMLTDFVSTRDAIEKGETRIIKTTQLSFLRNTWDYIGRGIRVFVHNDGHEIEITEHCNACNKDLRVGHDVSRLFIGGAFGELK